MTTNSTPSMYSSFNARALAPQEVARSFIPPRQYAVMTRLAHTIVVGPRGSGKTTLLKMLTPEALVTASGEGRLPSTVEVKFTGIFVPTDISWSKQLESYSRIGFSGEQEAMLLQSAVATSVLRSFVLALDDRCNLDLSGTALSLPAITLSQDDEARLVEAVANLWNLEPALPTLFGLRSALGERLMSIGTFVERETVVGSDGRNERFLESKNLGFGMGFTSAIAAALDLLEAMVPDVRNERWAFLFDELELAPPKVLDELLSALRSVDDRFLFKLSISPYGEDLHGLSGALSASVGHDYDEISLSYGQKDDGLDFSMSLMDAILESRRGPNTTISRFLEGSDAPGSNPAKRQRSRSHSGVLAGGGDEAIKELFYTDKSFRDYVLRSARDLDAFIASNGTDRAQVLRKILPLVNVRTAFRVPDDSKSGGTRRYRSAKNPDLYSGVLAVATALEGNPRWIIGFMNSVLEDGGPNVRRARQAQELTRTAHRFRSMLSTIPLESAPARSPRRGMLALIDAIGEYFKARVIADDFSPDPSGSFVVDAGCDNATLALLGSALNTGAIVYVPTGDDANVLASLRGKRFRLSYLLAMQYALPLRLQREISLAKILKGEVAVSAAQGRFDLEQ